MALWNISFVFIELWAAKIRVLAILARIGSRWGLPAIPLTQLRRATNRKHDGKKLILLLPSSMEWNSETIWDLGVL
jgi:hypothetical protein